MVYTNSLRLRVVELAYDFHSQSITWNMFDRGYGLAVTPALPFLLAVISISVCLPSINKMGVHSVISYPVCIVWQVWLECYTGVILVIDDSILLITQLSCASSDGEQPARDTVRIFSFLMLDVHFSLHFHFEESKTGP